MYFLILQSRTEVPTKRSRISDKGKSTCTTEINTDDNMSFLENLLSPTFVDLTINFSNNRPAKAVFVHHEDKSGKSAKKD
jgi:hypothetical protein